jgi:putative heme transporter
MSKRRLVIVAAGFAIVIATFAFVLPKIADYREVWATLRDLTWKQIVVLGIATVLNIVTFAPPVMATLPGVGFLRALVVTQASTASTYIAPGGAAVGIALTFAMLRGWGFSASSVTLSVALVGVWNQLFLLGAPTVALALLTLTGGSNPLLQTVALIAFAVFVAAVVAFGAALSGDSLARWVGNRAARLLSYARRVARRGPVVWDGEALVDFRARAIGLLRRRWWFLTLATIAGQLTVFLVLLASLRSLGVSSDQVSVVEAFASWTLVRLLGSLPTTPGGLGIVELGLTGALVGFGGNNAGVVAAVLLYRFLTIVPTLALGLVSAALWRRLRTDAAPAT